MKGLFALERLETFAKTFGNLFGENPTHTSGYEEEIAVIKKELQALEIIKEKQVDIELFSNRCKSCREYNYSVAFGKFNRDLTEEEFKLLKEVLD